MSACISSHGEYDAHETDPDTYVCKWCHEFDETGAMAEIARLRRGPVTGMDHAIEQAAQAFYAHRQSVGDFPDGLTDWGDLPESWRDEWREAGEHVVRALAKAGLLAPAPLREEALADDPEPWRCPGCNSDRWIRASLTQGLTVITQCVPCGRYVNCPPPGRAEGDGRVDQ